MGDIVLLPWGCLCAEVPQRFSSVLNAPLWKILKADENCCEHLRATMVQELITVSLLGNFNADIRKRAKISELPHRDG